MPARVFSGLVMAGFVLSACGSAQTTSTVKMEVSPTPEAVPSPTTPTSSPGLPEAEAALDLATVQARFSETLGAPNSNLDFAQVQFVKAAQTADGSWLFEATVRHNDQGWEHYADAWEVAAVDPESGQLGQPLATRVLLHPHDTEQPFTRSQSYIQIPPEVRFVVVRSKCNVHGYGGQVVLVDLSGDRGDNFEVCRP